MSSQETNTPSEASGGPIQLQCLTLNQIQKKRMGPDGLPEKEQLSRFQNMIDALQSGNDFVDDPFWPQLLFPIPSRETGAEYERSTMHKCIEILEHGYMGFVLGQAAQKFLYLPPDAAVRILSASEGRWNWILHWMQLFNRVLSIDGVEVDEVARKVCAEGLKKIEDLADKAPKRVIKPVFEWKTSESGDAPFGSTELERKELYPGWKPKARETGQSPFCRGVKEAIEYVKKRKDHEEFLAPILKQLEDEERLQRTRGTE